MRPADRVELGHWTRERIIEAIQRYNERYGRPPGAMDWNLAMARHVAAPERLAEIEARWQAGVWPYVNTVIARFDKWSLAIEAAGLTPLRPSERRDVARWRRNISEGLQRAHR